MSTLALGLLCFLLGVLVGVFARDALLRFIKRKPREAIVWLISNRLARRVICWARRNALILLVLMFAATQVALAVLLIQQRAASDERDRREAVRTQQFRAYVECSAAWQEQMSAAFIARTKAAKPVSKALDRVMQSVADKDPDAFNAALQGYLSIRVEQKAAQRENPPPSPPEQLCGVPPEAGK